MVLDQLHIAPQIVTITYAGALGMLALAGALAFGLGGRDLAAQMLGQAYDAGQRNAGQVKQDMQTGRERAEVEAQRASDGRPPDAVRRVAPTTHPPPDRPSRERTAHMPTTQEVTRLEGPEARRPGRRQDRHDRRDLRRRADRQAGVAGRQARACSARASASCRSPRRSATGTTSASPTPRTRSRTPQRGRRRRAVAGRGVPAVPALRARLLREPLGLRPARGRPQRRDRRRRRGPRHDRARPGTTSPARRPTAP